MSKKTKKGYPGLYEPLPQKIGINPDYIAVYNDLEPIRHKMRVTRQNSVKRLPCTGYLTTGAAKRMKRALNYLGLITPVKTVENRAKGYKYKVQMVFVTLTLSDKQKHTDNFIKNELLAGWIDVMLKRFPGLNYCWKAEKQKNGNIHFHVCIDHFIPKWYVSKVWNRLQRKHGYLDKYLAEKGTTFAPSTKIEKVRGTDSLKRYMRKYMVKGLKPKNYNELTDDQKKEFDKMKVSGKVWGCSLNLLVPAYTTHIDGLTFNTREFIMGLPVLVNDKYFQIFKIDNFKAFINGVGDYLKNELINHLKQLRPPNKPLCPVMVFDSERLYKY